MTPLQAIAHLQTDERTLLAEQRTEDGRIRIVSTRLIRGQLYRAGEPITLAQFLQLFEA